MDYAKEHHQLAELCSEADDGILIISKEGNIVFANEAAANFLASSRDDLVGKSLAEAAKFFYDEKWEKKWGEAQSNFVSIASHQLRTPLTSMRWFTEMLLGGDASELKPDQKRLLEQVYHGIGRTTRLVSALLRLAYAESGRTRLEPTQGDIRVITESIVNNFREVESKSVVGLHFMPEHMLTMPVDREALESVLQVLLTNAVYYSTERKEVIVYVAKKENEVEFSVKDFGIGIAKKDQPRIFERFFRAENGVRLQPDGWGLDLTLTKYMVEGWGGRIWFESEEGQGTTFYFTIPASGMRAMLGTG